MKSSFVILMSCKFVKLKVYKVESIICSHRFLIFLIQMPKRVQHNIFIFLTFKIYFFLFGFSYFIVHFIKHK
ncbi:MAG: hypothetical protein DRI94_10860 [Bacteroidetes bacterium]|nr:MAG: hypothetical protein DRI94_10860 [Bacteroidota bacterium]